MSSNDLNILKWWIDASHHVHNDLKGHTGATMSMGQGSVYSTSIKQKLNTKSSTESELVGIDEVLPQVLWTNYFLKEQGYDIQDTVVYQDNKITILLEKNGQLSSSKCTKHIQARYYFIKQCIDRKQVSVQHCPTEDMIADFFTKPLQGKKFKEFRDLIMNL